jgi:propionyl-CoA carboxylase alpha chain/3-methylcrotonyl-CoA carboxylase alpha subunit
VTGVDLVEWQFRVASGEPLPLRQGEIVLNGHALEARLYAENPAAGFLPSIGVLEHFRMPAGIRVDSAVEEGDEVSPHYDPMIAKLIAHAPTRELAAEGLARGCRAIEVWPVKTNAAFLARCAAHPDFVVGNVDTGFIEARLSELIPEGAKMVELVAALALAAEYAEGAASSRRDYYSPWDPDPDCIYGFRMNGAPRAFHRVRLGGLKAQGNVVTAGTGDRGWQVTTDGFSGWARVDGSTVEVEGLGEVAYANVHPDRIIFHRGEALACQEALHAASDRESASDGAIRSPMPGKIVSVSVKAGDRVTKGQPLLVLEAMKMEHALTAPFDGVVAELNATAGGQVSEGVVLAKLEASV